MKISELIEKMDGLKMVVGDIEVVYFDDDYRTHAVDDVYCGIPPWEDDECAVITSMYG